MGFKIRLILIQGTGLISGESQYKVREFGYLGNRIDHYYIELDRLVHIVLHRKILEMQH